VSRRLDSVDRVVDAINAGNLDAFVAGYAPGATIEDGYDAVLASGREGIRSRYSTIFAEFPDLRVEPLSRTEVGEFVVQEERVTGRGDPARHVAVYLMEDGLITRERLLA
jgi:hypothetical protein